MYNYTTSTQDQISLPIHIRVDPDERGVRKALRRLVDILHAQKVAAGLVKNCELVLAEVLNNIIEHALAECENGVIGLSGTISKTALKFEITDNGKPMPDEELPTACTPRLDSDLQNLPEGGFGWFLIHSQTDNLIYTRHAGYNALKLSFLR